MGFLPGWEFPLFGQDKREGSIEFLVHREIDRLGIRIELGIHGFFQDKGPKKGRTALFITQSHEASDSLRRCLELPFRCGRGCCLHPDRTWSNLKTVADVGEKLVGIFSPSKERLAREFFPGTQFICHFFSRANSVCWDHRRSCRRRRFPRP